MRINMSSQRSVRELNRACGKIITEQTKMGAL